MIKKYRKNSGIVLVNKQKLVFIGKRSDFYKPEDGWQMPQGGVDAGEVYLEAAARELSEEVGIKNFSIMSETRKIYSYKFPDSKTHFGKDIIGQKQKWFLAKFLGEDSEIKISHEFSDWKWANVEEALSLIVDFKKNIYRSVFSEFKKFF